MMENGSPRSMTEHEASSSRSDFDSNSAPSPRRPGTRRVSDPMKEPPPILDRSSSMAGKGRHARGAALATRHDRRGSRPDVLERITEHSPTSADGAAQESTMGQEGKAVTGRTSEHGPVRPVSPVTPTEAAFENEVQVVEDDGAHSSRLPGRSPSARPAKAKSKGFFERFSIFARAPLQPKPPARTLVPTPSSEPVPSPSPNEAATEPIIPAGPPPGAVIVTEEVDRLPDLTATDAVSHLIRDSFPIDSNYRHGTAPQTSETRTLDPRARASPDALLPVHQQGQRSSEHGNDHLLDPLGFSNSPLVANSAIFGDDLSPVLGSAPSRPPMAERPFSDLSEGLGIVDADVSLIAGAHTTGAREGILSAAAADGGLHDPTDSTSEGPEIVITSMQPFRQVSGSNAEAHLYTPLDGNHSGSSPRQYTPVTSQGSLSAPFQYQAGVSPSSGSRAPKSFDYNALPEDDWYAKASEVAKLLLLDNDDTDEGRMPPEKVAGWLGSHKRFNTLVLEQYIKAFDFKDQKIDESFRTLCTRLHLRAESQQLDRILTAFARRYWACNPDTNWGSEENVQIVAFSILVLNTDLSVVEYSRRMSRHRYVTNTLESLVESHQANTESPSEPQVAPSAISVGRRSSRLGNWRSDISESGDTELARTQKSRRVMLEHELREIYESLRAKPIQIRRANLPSAPSSTSLAESAHSTSAGRMPSRPGTHDFSGWRNGLGGTLERRSLIRGERTASVMSGRSSNLSMRSDVMGSLWPTHEGLGSKEPSSIGFAHTLSHSIIKESDDASDALSIVSDATDEELLMLHGPPWAKEGTLHVKEFLDSKGRKPKSRHWTQLFVVMDRGRLKTFDFSAKRKNGAGVNGGGVGAGNWLAQATPINSFSLAHTLTQSLPHGYNASREFVFAVNLPSGGMIFFQAGTRDLLDEWVQTCNYWAARVSREPLLGGVSSIEYGWNRVITSARTSPSVGGSPITVSSYNESDPQSIFNARIREWTPPQPSEAFATTTEDQQHDALQQYSRALRDDMALHLDLKEKMYEQFLVETSPKVGKRQITVAKSPNKAKAMANWDRKHNYLQAECHKISKYIWALEEATTIRAKLRANKYQVKSEEIYDKNLQELDDPDVN